MKVKVITETLNNLDIAVRQLDRAISLFFDEEDYISSLTLAGAAEEILGKILNHEMSSSHSLDEVIKGALRLNDVPTGGHEEKKAKKEIANIANFFKNRLKHYNAESDLTFSVDFYAAEIIDRAIENYFKITSNETPLMTRFKNEVLLATLKK